MGYIIYQTISFNCISYDKQWTKAEAREMKYESVQQTAKRLNVTNRAVQKWAKEGKIHGAYKHGRDWMIPTTCCHPGAKPGISDEGIAVVVDTPMPLMQGVYTAGEAKTYIDSIEDKDRKNIALGEYCYYTGNVEKCAKILEPYFYSVNPANRCTAALISMFANLSNEHMHKAEFSASVLNDILEQGLRTKSTKQLEALGVMLQSTVEIKLHDSPKSADVLYNFVRYLDEPFRHFSCYLLSYKAYLEKDYSRSLGIADTSLVCFKDDYTLLMGYLHIMAAIDLVNLQKTDEALERMEQSWEILKGDKFIVPYVEHYNMLCGLVEKFFKNRYPQVYSEIIALVRTLSVGMSRFHNKRTGRNVVLNLTVMEFTIAMLYNRGWTTSEIADHMDLDENVVKDYIHTVYEKLSISSKEELEHYMTK